MHARSSRTTRLEPLPPHDAALQRVRRTVAVALTVAGVVAASPSLATAAAHLPRSYSVTVLGNDANSLGEDVNDRGQVVGVASDTAFWWEGGTSHFLGAGVATGINRDGEIAGFTRNDGPRGFAWESCTTCDALRPLPSLGGGANEAWAINDRGQLAGLSSGPAGDLRPVAWQDGTVLDIAERTGNVTRLGIANDINDAGDVAGSTIFTSGIERDRGFVYRRGALIELPPLGTSAGTSSAMAVNDRGVVAGTSQLAPGGPVHATLWRRGAARDLGTLPGGDLSQAEDINDAGLVVGVATRTTGGEAPLTGFVSDGRRMVDLSDLVPAGVHITWASAINERGQITGAASPGGAVLLTPRD